MDLISPLELQFGKAEEGGSIDDVHISDGSNICFEKVSAYLRLQLLLTMELLRMFWFLLFEMFDIIKNISIYYISFKVGIQEINIYQWFITLSTISKTFYFLHKYRHVSFSHNKSVAKTCYVVARDLLFFVSINQAEPFSWECQSECVSIFQKWSSTLTEGWRY